MSSSILSFQSHVSYGYAGNSVASFILQRMGYRVMAVNTVSFSNHTGYGKTFGYIVDDKSNSAILNGLIEMGFAQKCRCAISGYLGSGKNGTAFVEFLKKIKKVSNVIVCIDPVMGDVGRGIFVSDDVVHFLTHEALQHADIITPNEFEAELLSGIKIKSLDDARDVAFELYNKMSPTRQYVIIKSVTHTVGSNLFNVIFDGNKFFVVESSSCDFSKNSAKRAPGGLGDAFTAIFIGKLLKNMDPILSLETATGIMLDILKDNLLTNHTELNIIKNQNILMR